AYAVIYIQRIPGYPEQPNPGFAFQPDQGYIPVVINERGTRLNVRSLQSRCVALQTGFGPLLRKVRHGVHASVARPVFRLEHHEIAIIVGNFEPRTTGMRRHEMHRLAPRVIPRFRHRPHAVTPPSTPTHDRRAVINGDLVQPSPRGGLSELSAGIASAARVRVLHRHGRRVVRAAARANAFYTKHAYVEISCERREVSTLRASPITLTELQLTTNLRIVVCVAPVHNYQPGRGR